MSRILSVKRLVCVLGVEGQKRGMSWHHKAQFLKWPKQGIGSVRKNVHTRVHSHMHHQPRAFTSSCEHQTPMRAAHSNIAVYLSSSFCYRSPIRCWSMAELTRVRQFALYSALGQSKTMHCCLSGTLRCKDLRNWDFPFRSWCFFSSQPLRVSNRFKVRD